MESLELIFFGMLQLRTTRECNRRHGRGNTSNSSSSGTNGLTPNTTGDGWELGRNPNLHFTSSSLQGGGTIYIYIEQGFPNIETKPHQLFTKQLSIKTTLGITSHPPMTVGAAVRTVCLSSAEGVHFTHTIRTYSEHPSASEVRNKAFREQTQVRHMPTRGVPDRQQVRSQTMLCQEARGSSPTPPRRIHMPLDIKAPPISNLLSQGLLKPISKFFDNQRCMWDIWYACSGSTDTEVPQGWSDKESGSNWSKGDLPCSRSSRSFTNLRANPQSTKNPISNLRNYWKWNGVNRSYGSRDMNFGSLIGIYGRGKDLSGFSGIRKIIFSRILLTATDVRDQGNELLEFWNKEMIYGTKEKGFNNLLNPFFERKLKEGCNLDFLGWLGCGPRGFAAWPDLMGRHGRGRDGPIEGARGEREADAGGRGSPRGTHMAAAWFTVREAHAGAALGFGRGSGARRGARRTRRRRAHMSAAGSPRRGCTRDTAPRLGGLSSWVRCAGWTEAQRAHVQPHGAPWSVRTGMEGRGRAADWLRWPPREREREAELVRIGRLTAAERRRRTAARRSEVRTPVARGEEEELIPRLRSKKGGTTAAGGGGEARRMPDADAREKGCDAHAVTRNPMVTGDARAAALSGGGRGDAARRGGSISGVLGIRFRRRMGRRSTEESRRRAAASGTEHDGRRASARRKGGERRFGGVFHGDQGGRQREELGGELTDGDGRRRWRGNRKPAAERGRGEGGGKGGTRSSSSRVHARTGSSGAWRRMAMARAGRATTMARR
uniref:Fibroin-like n=1 Tax=Oryza glumipatula TaxID=40148 RepID=A0A1V1H0D7_9ORYZ|nr:fibroin -like [Oryza glumipatula]